MTSLEDMLDAAPRRQATDREMLFHVRGLAAGALGAPFANPLDRTQLEGTLRQMLNALDTYLGFHPNLVIEYDPPKKRGRR